MEAAEEEPNLRQHVFDTAAFKTKLVGLCTEDPSEKETDDLCKMLDAFQEEPYLLDPYLESMVGDLVLRFKAALQPPQSQLLPYLSRLVYTCIKVRGYKTAVKLFPHDPSDLTFLLDLLNEPPESTDYSWMVQYISLLWLSLVVKLPFDLKRWDTDQGPSTLDRIMGIAFQHLNSPGVDREAASIVLGALCSRPQDGRFILPQLIENFETMAASSQTTSLQPVGLLQSINESLRRCELVVLQPFLPRLYELLAELLPREGSSTYMFGKASIKFAGRTALAFVSSLKEEDEIPEQVEVVLSELLAALASKDSSIRYSAAKYVARLTEKLPSEMALQVIQGVEDIFESQAQTSDLSLSDNAWQGACLAVAELVRRSLVPANRLSLIIPPVSRALRFDIRRGSQSIGTGVRDAACYVLWTLARAFNADELLPFEKDLQARLVCASLFDREVQIRRAASAAFQEIVGRHSLFPHGIAVLQEMNFFTVGLRRKAFLQVAVSLARFEEYFDDIATHLEQHSLVHWDNELRSLAAEALAKIFIVANFKDLDACQDRLRSVALGVDDIARHGAMLGLIELAPLTNAEERAKSLDLLAQLKAPPAKGNFAALISSAGCGLIDRCASEETAQAHMESALIFVDAAIARDTESCQEGALRAIQALSLAIEEQRPLVKRYLAKLAGFSPAAQQGAALCLGGFIFPAKERIGLQKVWNELTKAIDPKNAKSIPTRRNSLSSLKRLAKNHQLLPKEEKQLLKIILDALKDYTTDTRGDVGSQMRMEALDNLPSTLLLVNAEATEKDEATSLVLKLCLDRMDSVREKALQTVQALSQYAIIPLSVNVTPLVSLLKEGQARSTETVFPRMLPFVLFELHRTSILEGISLQVGVPPEAQNNTLSDDLKSFLSSLPVSHQDTSCSQADIVESLAVSIVAHFQDARQFTCLVYTSALFIKILESNTDILRAPFEDVLQKSTRLVGKSKNLNRIKAVGTLCLEMLSLRSAHACATLRILLTHPLIQIRQWTSSELRTSFPEVSAQSQLTSVHWDDEEAARLAGDRFLQSAKELYNS